MHFHSPLTLTEFNLLFHSYFSGEGVQHSGLEYGFRSPAAWVQVPAPPFACCVATGRYPNLPVPQFTYLCNGDDNNLKYSGENLTREFL